MCHDNSVTFLQSLGYNVVRLPREGINPLLLAINKSNNLHILGSIADLMLEEPKPLPEIENNLEASNINGLKSSEFEIGIGLKLLEKILSAMGAGNVGLSAVYQRAKSIQFEYNNVKFDRVFPLTLARYLRVAKPDITSDQMEEILDTNKEQPFYVLIETLKSNSFEVTAYDNNNAKLSVDIDALQQLLTINPNISVSRKDQLAISYQGDKNLTFAFKAVPVWIEIRGTMAILKLAPAVPTPPLMLTAISPDLDDPEQVTTVLIGEPSRLLKIS